MRTTPVRPSLLTLLCVASACAPQNTISSRPNILLVSYDGLRADHAGVYGNPNQPTPTLDRLASEGIRFESSFSQSNESLYSHASMLTGRYVEELAYLDYFSFTVPDSALLVSEVLDLYGYNTAAFVAGAHLRAEYGFKQGFSVYDDRHDFGSMFDKAREAMEWLDHRATKGRDGDPRPFFLVLQAYDCHRPYLRSGPYYHALDTEYEGMADPMLVQRFSVDQTYNGVYYRDFPTQILPHLGGVRTQDPYGNERIAAWAASHQDGTRLTETDINHIRAHYDSGVFSLDIQLGLFLEGLEQRGRLNDTLVILTADHGEDLQEHGYFDHRSNLRDTTTRVPLVLWGAGIPPEARGTVRTDLTQAIDIVPTILGAAGIQAPANARGRNLLHDTSDFDGPIFQVGVLPQFSARTRTHRLVFFGFPATFPLLDLALEVAPLDPRWFKLFDLRTDPEEQTNVVTSQPETADALRRDLLRWHRSLPISTEWGRQVDNPGLQALLTSRGYW